MLLPNDIFILTFIRHEKDPPHHNSHHSIHSLVVRPTPAYRYYLAITIILYNRPQLPFPETRDEHGRIHEPPGRP